MDIIARNHTVLTKALFYESMAAADSVRKSLLRGMGIVLLAWLALLGITLFRKLNLVITLLELAVIAAIGLWLLVIQPLSRYRRAYDKLKKKSEKDPEYTMYFLEDRVEIVSGTGTETLDYYLDVKDVVHTKNALVLVGEYCMAYPADLSAFTEGSADLAEAQIRAYQETLKMEY